VPNKPSKPQLRLQTWGMDKIREEKKRQYSTAVRRRGSKDKDARNRERKATKATERPCKGRQMCPRRPLEQPREGTSVLC